MWGLRPLRTVEVGNACLENLVKALEERGVVVDPPDAPAVEPGHRHARLPQRLDDDLHAAPRHPAHHGQRDHGLRQLLPLPLLRVPGLLAAHEAVLRRGPGLPVDPGPAPAPDRQVLQAQLLRREDLAGGAPGAHRQQGLRHDGSRADVGRRRRHAHGQGPVHPARPDHQPHGHGLVPALLPRAPRARP